jgi:hypothetical protein
MSKSLNLGSELVIRWLVMLFAVLAASPEPLVFAQASLISEDIIDDIRVGNETFTVVRDAVRREQWYYVPDRPRLYERVSNQVAEPEFTLLKYQFDDPQHHGNLLEGGLLQFSSSLMLPSDVIEGLRDQISGRRSISKEIIRLSAMPIKSADVLIYTPQSATLLAEAPKGNGIAPTFATQKMVFTVPLTAIGADVYAGLVDSATGVPVMVSYTYEGLTPPGGFTVFVDYDQTYRHYSESSSFRAEASYLGLFGGGYTRTSESIFNELVNSHCIRVDLTVGENFTMAQAQGYLQPILARINSELLEASKPPDKVDPAKASAAAKGGWWGSVNYSVATKSEVDRKHGTETFDFHVRSIMDRKTVASGFIGIGKYPDEIRKKLVFNSVGTFQRAFFLLPGIEDVDQMGIRQVQLEVNMRSDANNLLPNPKTVSWTPKQSWSDGAQTMNVIAFGLGGFGLSQEQIRRLKFVESVRISLKNGPPLEYKQTVDAFNGTLGIPRPTDNLEIVTVDGQSLSWKRLDTTSKLEAVEVAMASGNRAVSETLRPQLNNGKWEIPKPFYWLVGRSLGQQADPLSVTIRFRLDDGTTSTWSHSGDLRQNSVSSTIVLFDSDWKH